MNYRESSEKFRNALENQGKDTIPDPAATWAILDLAADYLMDSSPAGQYARRTVYVLPESEQTDLGTSGDLDSDTITRKLKKPKTAKAAAVLCARHGIPIEGRRGRNYSVAAINALGEYLSVDDADVRAWSAKAFDYTYEFDPDPVSEQLLEAVEDPDPRVRAAAIGALCQDIWRRDTIPAWVEPAIAALGDGLVDDVKMVRTRTASMVESPALLVETKLWANGVSPETRAQVVRNATTIDFNETASDKRWIKHPAEVMADMCLGEVWEYLEEHPEFE